MTTSVRIRNVELLDTGQPAFVERRDLLIVDGLIAGNEVAAGTDALTIDGSQLTALPGFVDAHYHCTYAGHVGIGQLEDHVPDQTRFERASANAATAIRHGVTSVLDVGSHGFVAVRIRDAIARGEIRGPDMRVSGQILIKAGGPLDLWPMEASPTRLFAVVDGPKQIEAAIEEQAEGGVDAIKLQISASAVQSDGPPGGSSFSAQELETAVLVSHRLGLVVSMHAEGDVAISEAMRAGVDVIQHGSFASPKVLGEIKAAGTGLVFTLGVYAAILRGGQQVAYPPESVERVRRHWSAMIKTVRDAAEMDVPFGLGSDCGGKAHPHGDYLDDLVSVATDVGLPLEEALTAASRGSAQAARIADAGSLSVGAPANLVLAASAMVHGDLAGLRDAANLVVLKRGVVEHTGSAMNPG